MGEKQTDEKISSNMMSQSMIFITKWSSRLRDQITEVMAMIMTMMNVTNDKDDHLHDIGDGND